MPMITKKMIKEVYKKYHKKPKSVDCINVSLLFGDEMQMHDIEIVDDDIVINSLEPSSLFHKIALQRVYGIEEFEKSVAIVLHSSMIFLKKGAKDVAVHIKPQSISIWDRIKMLFNR